MLQSFLAAESPLPVPKISATITHTIASAFVQQRAKILPAAFESLFHHFTDRICEQKTYNGYRLFAVDGSDLQIAANPQDADSFYPGANGQKSYNLLHINATDGGVHSRVSGIANAWGLPGHRDPGLW